MDYLKIPAWLLSMALSLFAIGFLISLFVLTEPRYFMGMNFGPESEKVIGLEVKSKTTNTAPNGQKVVLPNKTLCQLERVGGAGHCVLRNENGTWTLENSNKENGQDADCSAICFDL